MASGSAASATGLDASTSAAPPLAATAARSAHLAPAATPAVPRPTPLGIPIDDRLARPTLGWTDRLRAVRDRILMSRTFQRWSAIVPFTRPIARRRARAVFDLCAGFVYSQTLSACLQLDLFGLLRDGPLTLAALAARTGMPVEGMLRLLRAAASLRLVERRGTDGWALGALGAPLATNGELASMVRHHGLLYEDLRDPVAVLRLAGATGAGEREAMAATTALATYWPYAATADPRTLDAEHVRSYSTLMTTTVPPVVAEVLDAYDFSRHRSVLDVGGGEGEFAAAVALRHPRLASALFDLPAVAERARAALAARGADAARVRVHGGDFHADALPTGADVVTLVRILLDHPDEAALALLRRVHAALPPDGRVLIAEPFAGARGAEPVGDAYFGFYLLAMGRGRARTVAEHRALLEAAGFHRVRERATRYAIQTGVLIAER